MREEDEFELFDFEEIKNEFQPKQLFNMLQLKSQQQNCKVQILVRQNAYKKTKNSIFAKTLRMVNEVFFYCQQDMDSIQSPKDSQLELCGYDNPKSKQSIEVPDICSISSLKEFNLNYLPTKRTVQTEEQMDQVDQKHNNLDNLLKKQFTRSVSFKTHIKDNDEDQKDQIPQLYRYNSSCDQVLEESEEQNFQHFEDDNQIVSKVTNKLKKQQSRIYESFLQKSSNNINSYLETQDDEEFEVLEALNQQYRIMLENSCHYQNLEKAKVLMKKGQLKKAKEDFISIYKETYKRVHENQNNKIQLKIWSLICIKALIYLSQTLKRLGTFQQANFMLEQCEKIFEVMDPEIKGKIYLEKANNYLHLLNFKKALETFESALVIFEQFNWKLEIALTLSKIGLTLGYLKKFDEAKLVTFEALKIYNYGELHRSMVTAYNLLGMMSVMKDLDLLAIRQFQKAIVCLSDQDSLAKGQLYNNLGLAQFKKQQVAQYKISLDRAYEVYSQNLPQNDPMLRRIEINKQLSDKI